MDIHLLRFIKGWKVEFLRIIYNCKCCFAPCSMICLRFWSWDMRSWGLRTRGWVSSNRKRARNLEAEAVPPPHRCASIENQSTIHLPTSVEVSVSGFPTWLQTTSLVNKTRATSSSNTYHAALVQLHPLTSNIGESTTNQCDARKTNCRTTWLTHCALTDWLTDRRLANSH